MASPTSSTSSGKRSKATYCKVQGCTADLSCAGASRYCLKKRLCPKHLRADSLRTDEKGDSLFRFCQQCGKLELLTCFEGDKRSCRISLAKRRVHHHADDSQPCNQQQQQSPIHVLMPTSSGLISTTTTSNSSQDSCGAAAVMIHPALVSDTCWPAVMTSAAEPCAWSADAAAAALAEAWCGQQQQEELGTCAVGSLLDLELQRSSNSSNGDAALMLLLEQELLAAAAEAGVNATAVAAAGDAIEEWPHGIAPVPVADSAIRSSTGSGWPALDVAVPAAAAAAAAEAPVQCQTFNTWSALPTMTHCMAGAFTSRCGATLQQRYAAHAGPPPTAATYDAPSAVAISQRCIQQRLQLLAMQYAQLVQVHAMLMTVQDQGQQASAAVLCRSSVCGASDVTNWFPYM